MRVAKFTSRGFLGRLDEIFLSREVNGAQNERREIGFLLLFAFMKTTPVFNAD